MARLAAGQGAFKELGDVHPALRVEHCEHHYVREQAPALIVAILHERMDLLVHVARRL